MVDKRFCDRCGKEMGFMNHGELSFNLKSDRTHIKDSNGKEISCISGTSKLCLDCYNELVDFMTLKLKSQR